MAQHTHFHWPVSPPDPTAQLTAIQKQLTAIQQTLVAIQKKESTMATQADIDALAQRLGSAVSAIQQEITTLQQQPAAAQLDFTGLNDAVSQVENLELPPAAPAQ